MIKNPLSLGLILLSLSGLSSQALSASLIGTPVTQGSLRVTAYDVDCIRIEYSRDQKFEDLDTLFSRRAGVQGVPMSVTRNGDQTFFETEAVRIGFTETGVWPDQKSLWAEVKIPGGRDRYWNYGKKNQWNLGGTKQGLDYVGGEVPVSEGMLARDGWYFLEDAHRPLMDESGWIKKRDPTGIIDGYLFAYGNQFHRAFQCLKTIAGPTPLPRKRSFGVWYSRWWKYSQDDFREIVKEFKERLIPLDMLVFDMNWHEKGWTGYTWNQRLMPEGQKFIQELDQQGIGVTLNDHPQGGISPSETQYNAVMKALGRDPASKSWVEFNAGDRRLMDVIFNLVHAPFLREGAEFWWLDWMGDNKYEFNRLDWLNHLYFELSKQSGQRPQGFSRWSDWGNHRYPIQFSGDTLITWDMLRFLVPFTANSGNVGANYWSHDIGGFIDKNFRVNAVLGQKQTELYVRWAQYSVFSPIYRFHSVNHWHLDKRPWKWGAEAERIVSDASRLRGKLLPTIYAEADTTFRTNMPLVRPMYVMHPGEEDAYVAKEQYYFGERLMVAPILVGRDSKTGLANKKVWFPKSERWFDLYDGSEVLKKGWLDISVPLDLIPAFARGGYPVLLQPDGVRSARAFKEDLTLVLHPGAPGLQTETFIYDDDGRTDKYLQGEFHRVPVSYSRSGSGLDEHRIRFGKELRAFGCQKINVHLKGFPAGSRVEMFNSTSSIGSGILEKGTRAISVPCVGAIDLRVY